MIKMTFYHVSHVINRSSINELGLIPGKGVTPWPEDVYPAGIYLFSSLKEAHKYGFGNGDPFDVWQVRALTDDLLEDPVTKGARYSPKPIGRSAIKLLESHETDVTNPCCS